MTTMVFSVPEVSCGACQSAIESALSPVAGVQSVQVDLEAKTVTVDYDDTVSPATLTELIEDQGYDVAGMQQQGAGGDQR